MNYETLECVLTSVDYNAKCLCWEYCYNLTSVLHAFYMTGLPHILEKKFTFQVLEMPLNVSKSGNNIDCESICLEQKSLCINIMPVEEKDFTGTWS